MTKQAGYIKLEDTIGDLSYYKNRDCKFIARRKGGVTRKGSSKILKFLKNAFREIEIKSNVSKLHNRVYSIAMKMVKSTPFPSVGNAGSYYGTWTC